jgi:hypothetical protein
MALASFVLGVSSVFAIRTNKRFASFTTVIVVSGCYKITLQYTCGMIFTTGTGVSNAIRVVVYTGSVATGGVLVSGPMTANGHEVRLR